METMARIRKSIHDDDFGGEGKYGQATLSALEKATDRLGERTMADVLSVMKGVCETMLTTDGKPLPVGMLLTLGCDQLRDGPDSSVSKFLFGSALRSPYVFNPGFSSLGGIHSPERLKRINDEHEGFMSSVPESGRYPIDLTTLPVDDISAGADSVVAHGLDWMTTMLARFIELIRRDDLVATDHRLHEAGGPGYAAPVLVGMHVIESMYRDGLDSDDPHVYAETLETGMAKLYATGEPSATILGAFSSLSPYLRWRKIVDERKSRARDGSIPLCVESLDSIYDTLYPLPSYESSGLGGRMVEALESDGPHDYSAVREWLESLTAPVAVATRCVPARARWSVRTETLLHTPESDATNGLLLSQEDPAKLLGTLDFIGVVNAACPHFGAVKFADIGGYGDESTVISGPTVKLEPKALLDAVGMLEKGTPTGTAITKLAATTL